MSWNEMLKQLLDRATNLKYDDHAELDDILRIIALYSEKLFGNAAKYGNPANRISLNPGIYDDDVDYYKSCWESGRKELCNLINTMVKDYEITSIHEAKPEKAKASSKNKNIFVVHGHDENLKLRVSNWLYSVGLKPIILHYQPNMGIKSIIDKISQYSDVNAAIILFTPDDEGKCKTDKQLEDRARQNVVFEAGYFIGKLGADRVVVISEPSITIPSDLSGCIYISTKESWEEKIRIEFKAMGISME